MPMSTPIRNVSHKHILRFSRFSDIRFRAGEKQVSSSSIASVHMQYGILISTQVYNKLRTHNDIRYTIKKIEKPSDKVFILIQAILSAINLSDPEYKAGDTQPYTESLPILRHISRIARGTCSSFDLSVQLVTFG